MNWNALLMTPAEIRQVVREFLEFIESGAGSVDANLERLPYLLDRLALTYHSLGSPYDDRDLPDAPCLDHASMRARAANLFPDFGYYNEVDDCCVNIAESGIIVGDAIDDIADIAQDLYEVEWRWQNNSEADGMWSLKFPMKHHAGNHMRSLQYYLMRRRPELDRLREELGG